MLLIRKQFNDGPLFTRTPFYSSGAPALVFVFCLATVIDLTPQFAWSYRETLRDIAVVRRVVGIMVFFGRPIGFFRIDRCPDTSSTSYRLLRRSSGNTHLRGATEARLKVKLSARA